MRDPLVIAFNDIHLKPSNEQDVIASIIHMLEYAKSKNIDTLIGVGDLFESRTFQRQSTLEALDKILGLIHEAGCTLYFIPGNHDKTDYNSFYSFLEVYRHFPNVKLIRDIQNIKIKDVSITLLPFFADEMLIPMINEAEGADMLISHFEMKGSVNLGHVSDKKNITRRMFRKWKKVYLGHFHNAHEISENIKHLPSLRQNNFGEDSNKGFTVLYDDLTDEIIKGRFKEFCKIIIDINKTDSKAIKELIRTHENSVNTIRFEFIGEESKLKALDRSQFEGTGISVKLKYESIFDPDQIEKPVLIKKYDENQVIESFEIFCEEKGYDYEKGMELFNEFLKRKNDKN